MPDPDRTTIARPGRLRGTRSGRESRTGFTLVELLIVILILTMGTTVVSLSFEALVPGARLNTSVRVLAGTLADARSNAIARNAEIFIEYDLEGNRYRIASTEHVNGGPWIDGTHDEDERIVYSWEKLLPGVEFATLYLAGQVFTDETVYVRFDPLGAVSDHRVTIRQPDYNNEFTIEMLPLTGLIRFHEGVQDERDPPTDRDFD